MATSTMIAFGKSNIIFVAFEAVVCLLGIFFNALVIFTICRNIFRLSAPCYLILSIAVSDFLSCSVAIALSVARQFRKEWPFGMVGCQAHAFMIFLLALVSLSHLAAISAGKYLTITKSLSRQSYFDKKKVMNVIIASWIFSIGFSAAPLVGWSRIYGLEGIQETCSDEQDSSNPSDQIYFGTVFFASYFLAMTVITFCYYKIHHLTKNIVHITSQMGGLPAMTITRALLKKHHRSSMYFFIVIASFMLSWSPYAVVSFLIAISIRLDPIASSACSVFAKTSLFLNPILYAIISRKFRRRMAIAVPITRPNRRVRPAVVPSSVGQLAL